jgi:hypothetical protein
MRGMIIGGWEYVYAAYIVTASVLVFYTLSVIWRYRKESAADARRESGELE